MTFTSTLILWLKAHCSLYKRLSVNILREVNLYFARDQLLPATYAHSLVIHNSATWQHWVLPLPPAIPCGALFCIVDSVIAIAFYETSVTRVDMLDCLITSLPSLSTPRRCQSLLAFRGIIYVFGGICENRLTPTCLRLGLRVETWTALPDMQSEYCLTWPALWQEEVYIIPKLSGDCIEVFTIASQSFRVMPRPEDFGWKGLFGFGKDDQLLILRSDGLLDRWNLVTKELVLGRKTISASISELTCSPHVTLQKVLWLARGKPMLYQLDLSSSKINTTKLEVSTLI